MDRIPALWYTATEVVKMAKTEKRFVEVYREGIMEPVQIIADRVTGVQYLLFSNASGPAVSVLMNADGKPLLAEQPIEDWDDKKKRERHPWG